MYPFVATSVLMFWHLPISLIASYLLSTWPACVVWMAVTFVPELVSILPACPHCCLPAVPLTSVMKVFVPVRTRDVGNSGWGACSVPQRDGGGAQEAWGRGTGSGVVCWTLGQGDGHWWAPWLGMMGLDLIRLACNLPEKALALVYSTPVVLVDTLVLTLLAQERLSSPLQVMTRESNLY